MYQFAEDKDSASSVPSDNTRPMSAIQQTRVEDLMIPAEAVVLINKEATVNDFYGHFIKYGYHGYPVVNEVGTIIGTISYWHIRKKKANESDLIQNIMYRIEDDDPIKISKDVSIEDAYKRILENTKFTRLFVFHNRDFLGLLAKSAIERIVATEREVA